MSLATTVITGATSGIGRETAIALAKKDHALYLLVRNMDKGEGVKQEIIAKTGNKNIYICECDVADLQSVRRVADELKAKQVAINVLINNAGGMFAKKELSKDGYEMTFATNHLGHFALTTGLLPLLEQGQARVINISSAAHKISKPDFDDINWEKRNYLPMKAYADAKLFNIYFTRSLAEKYAGKGITSFAVHPGVVKTGFGAGADGFSKVLFWLARPFMLTPEEGAKTSVFLAIEPGIGAKSSQYFTKCKLAKSSSLSWDEPNRIKLWDLSVKMAGKR